MKKNNITVITIHKGNLKNLRETCISINNQILKPHSVIVVASGVSLSKLNLPKKINYKFILNKDKSIYNAMNLAIENLDINNHFIFLNSGDVFNNNLVLYRVNKYLKLNTCLVGKVNLKYKKIFFKIKKRYYKKINYLPHAGFICPPINSLHRNKKKIKFNEKFKIDADGYWMRKIIFLNKYRTIRINETISIHALGGVSTNPTIKSIKQFWASNKFSFIKEVLKYLIRTFLPNKAYYFVIYFYRYNFSYDK